MKLKRTDNLIDKIELDFIKLKDAVKLLSLELNGLSISPSPRLSKNYETGWDNVVFKENG